MKQPAPKRAKVPQIEVPEVLVTIDSASTQDIDDAVSVEALPDGSFKVLVCIADPTKLVLPCSTEDENAKLLGATVYAGDSAVRKMLPGVISEKLGSLVAGHPRKAFVFVVTLDAGLDVSSFEISRQRITVSHRLTYEDVPEILQNRDHPCSPLITASSTLAHGLLAKRRGRGAMALYDLQRMIYMDEEGRLLQLARRDQVVGHIVVQELMILANTQLARYMVDHGIPGLFRNHIAKAAAPESAELATTMETWLKSGTADLSRAKEMFSVLLGRADYGATARGHYALAEACYTHGTSPLRRYADLVNLRQIKAHLRGDPFFYEQEDLQALGELLTTKAIERKEERSDGFKRVVQAHAARALERGTLEHLADHEMVQAIKIGAAGECLPAELSAELCRRLANSFVTDKITDALLVNLPAAAWSDELRAAFAGWVSLIPTRAVHLLMHGEQTGFIKAVQISAAGEGTSFEGLVNVATADRSGEFRAAASRKREAEQAACVQAVLWLVGVEPGEATGAAVTSSVNRTVTGNPKGALLELCQKHGINPPAFANSGQGPSHAMVFACEATLAVAGDRLVARANGASSKKEAEAVASADLLEQLKGRVGRAAPARAVQAGKAGQPAQQMSSNPIGTLQEMAQKMKWPSPAYAFLTISEVPPKFKATVTVSGPRAGQYSGEASTKQDAKAHAARAALSAQ